MRALVVDHDAPDHLATAEVVEPRPEPNQAVIRVVGTSLNRGEVVFRAPVAPAGTVLGWDASGIVIRAAADGSGPAAGSPVLTVDERGGGWAESRAIDTGLLAMVPPEADLVEVASLPVAGLSALRALRSIGSIAGRTILITGASGGVGRMAIQLAAREGAIVTAAAYPEHHPELRALGAAKTVSRPSEVDEPMSAAIDMVGGAFLPEAYRALEDGGTLVSVGHAAAAPEVFEMGDMQGKSKIIRGFYLFADSSGIGEDLAFLVKLMIEGELDPQISWRKAWTEYAEAVEALKMRRLHGKAVLEVGS